MSLDSMSFDTMFSIACLLALMAFIVPPVIRILFDSSIGLLIMPVALFACFALKWKFTNASLNRSKYGIPHLVHRLLKPLLMALTCLNLQKI